ncbi:MAG: IS30 family transposase [Acidimicrobiales bacterium]
MPGARLSRGERARIEAGIAAGETEVEIARAIGRHRTTVSREISAGGGCEVYRATAAHAGAAQRARRPGERVLAAGDELAELVAHKLAQRWSPHAIVAWLAAEGAARVCAETIYQACYQGVGLFKGAWRHLVCGRARRRPRRRAETARRNVLGDIVNISARPAAAADRTEAGHWEDDLIKGAMNRSGVATLVERLSRYTLLAELPGDCGAATTRAALAHLFARVPAHLRRSLTWDQGREMADWTQLRDDLELPVFFCDPHSPWQRPTNENTNRHLRRWLPKGTDLSVHTQTGLDLIAFKLNTMPWRLHNWTSATDQYNLLLGCNSR